MSHGIEFVETSIFTKQIKELATDDELKDLQVELIAQPDKGVIIRGTGGLRNVRMAVGSAGKSGSVRVLYVLSHADRIYLVLAYPKSVKENLTDEAKSNLKQLVKLLKGEGK
ncbi:type II toxin-antitoxin system RelE/ParE family toxin [Alteromonas sp. AMM-1]|uniref:type II toxin-antitoxin system RelE/ParE family toxin n=1 Tax=Alteromonas sp. AMM-1 TaxID=3394233 RepID=UPI0039A5D003